MCYLTTHELYKTFIKLHLLKIMTNLLTKVKNLIHRAKMIESNILVKYITT